MDFRNNYAVIPEMKINGKLFKPGAIVRHKKHGWQGRVRQIFYRVGSGHAVNVRVDALNEASLVTMRRKHPSWPTEEGGFFISPRDAGIALMQLEWVK